ncbi:MAG: hypothetical protein ABIQ52_06000, partial [Vicinamibacterales bacterium]
MVVPVVRRGVENDEVAGVQHAIVHVMVPVGTRGRRRVESTDAATASNTHASTVASIPDSPG